MQLRLLALLITTTFGSIGCATEDDGGSPVEIVPLPDARRDSGIATQQRLVVRDDATWASVWQQIVRFHQPAPAVPTIDFANSVVLVAAMGTKPTGGYAIDIDQMRVSAANATIFVTERSPGNSCVVTTALTMPVAVAVAPRFTGEARFVEHTALFTCR